MVRFFVRFDIQAMGPQGEYTVGALTNYQCHFEVCEVSCTLILQETWGYNIGNYLGPNPTWLQAHPPP